ncbi:hypothetical protein F4604DRAFT_1676140 [Suillus subluteus]|nr:hypothetical protein F4604DRAFT_1676140 [Suillus subluteus]
MNYKGPNNDNRISRSEDTVTMGSSHVVFFREGPGVVGLGIVPADSELFVEMSSWQGSKLFGLITVTCILLQASAPQGTAMSHCWGFANCNFNCNLKSLDIFRNQKLNSLQHNCEIPVGNESGSIADTTGKNGSLATLMPDFKIRQKDEAPSAVSGQAKVSLVQTNARLEMEVPPPTGHTSAVQPNFILSGQKATHFMCAFSTILAAVWWSVTAQLQLLHIAKKAKRSTMNTETFLHCGLSVRMGIHSGAPACEPDPITRLMDYLGSVVDRCARISASALGGQTMYSADVRKIKASLLNFGPVSKPQPARAIKEILQLQTIFVPVGEIKLKGLEIPEMASLVYPAVLLGRQRLVESGLNLSTSPSLSIPWVIMPTAPLHKLAVTKLHPMARVWGDELCVTRPVHFHSALVIIFVPFCQEQDCLSTSVVTLASSARQTSFV